MKLTSALFSVEHASGGKLAALIGIAIALLQVACGQDALDDRSNRNLRARSGNESLVLPAPAGDIRDALLHPDPLQRAAKVAILLDSLPPSALPDVRQAYDTAVLDLGDIELVLLAEWWSEFDPEGAFEWTRKEWVADHPRVVLAILRAWGRQDHAAAAAVAARFSAAPAGDVYMGAVVSGWAESGEPGLMEFIETLSIGGTRQRALTSAIRLRVLQDGPEATMQWAEQLPMDATKFRMQSLRRVASAVAEVDPEAARAFAVRNSAPEFVAKLYSRVATVLVRDQPAETMAWIAGLPPGRDKTDAASEAFRLWLALDEPAATRWIRGIKLEPALDGAVSVYARNLSLEDPELALEWAGRIHDEELRWPAVGGIARFWYLDDPESATTWVDANSDIPDLYRRKIFQVPQGMKRRHKRFRDAQPLPGNAETEAQG